MNLYDPRASSTYGTPVNNTNNGSGTASSKPWWSMPKVGTTTVEGNALPNLDETVQNQRNARSGMMGSQDAQAGDWLSRYSGALGNQEKMRAMYSRLGEEVGLPGLQRNAQNLNANLEAIPETYGNATRGFDVNANQLSRIVGTKSAALAPLAQRATTQAQNAQDQVATQMGMAQQEQAKELTPFSYEKDFLTDRIARETSGFNQDNQNELSGLIQKTNWGIQLTEAEKQRKLQLEMQSRQFAQEKSMAEQQFGYNKELANINNSAKSSGGNFDWGSFGL